MPGVAEEKKEFGDLKTKFEPICNKSKYIFGKNCETVVVSKRLVVRLCPRFMNAQAPRNSSMSLYMQPKKVLELNATHPVMTHITNQLEADENDRMALDMLSILCDMPPYPPFSRCATPPHSG
jgi:molecular chaperone HtpG